mmetsp:Transcript_44213/g.71077  ORF Transcript_44213/g.71077 Transcript_44213/m.71077 type:complete len:399 (+) Transcript_44213:106-1302(+)
MFGLFEKKSPYAATFGKGRVVMISGCKDEQTSGDALKIDKYFGLPDDVGAGGAGGACTNALMQILHRQNSETPGYDGTWGELILDLRKGLATAANEEGKKVFTQIPQLSSSFNLPLGEKFSIKSPESKRTKALLIGINYGDRPSGKLRGSHNDVKTMRQFITKMGFEDKPTTLKVLMDDGDKATDDPTKKNILSALKWLVKDAAPGDSLFMHFSGHGSEVDDINGDEASGKDQTMVPMDFDGKNGHIIDDVIYSEVVGKLPEGCELFCLFDCCHSGTIMDLPYVIAVTPAVEKEIEKAMGSGQAMPGMQDSEVHANKIVDGKRGKEEEMQPQLAERQEAPASGMSLHLIVIIIAVVVAIAFGTLGMGSSQSTLPTEGTSRPKEEQSRFAFFGNRNKKL